MLSEKYAKLPTPYYWVQIKEMPHKSKHDCCKAVGRVILGKTYFPLSKLDFTVFEQIVPKSSIKVRKL